jgi:outer membrane murein-binding lipoprotein Lpp
MKLISRLVIILVLVALTGCGKEDKPDKAADTRLFNAQLKTLEQAKQVEQTTQNAAEQQRQKIEQETQ